MNQKIYAYLRTSTTDQTLEQQQQRIKGAYGPDTEFVWLHDQLSGWEGDRPDYEVLKKCIGKNWVKELCVVSVSRLGRNVQEAMRFLELCRKHDVHLRVLAEGLDFSGPMGYALFALFSALAQMDSDTKSQNIKAKFKLKKERDGWQCHGSPPHCLAAKVIQKAEEVYSMLDAEKSQKHIAKMLELTESTITKLVRRRGTPLFSRAEFGRMFPGWQNWGRDKLLALPLDEAVRRCVELRAEQAAA